MKFDVEMYLSPLCTPFRNLIKSMGMDETISVCGAPLISRREIERQVREWKIKSRKKPRSAVTPGAKPKEGKNQMMNQTQLITWNFEVQTSAQTTSDQLPPLAADIHGLATSIGVLAGKVPAEEWEYLSILRRSLRAAADQVAERERSLEVPS